MFNFTMGITQYKICDLIGNHKNASFVSESTRTQDITYNVCYFW